MRSRHIERNEADPVVFCSLQECDRFVQRPVLDGCRRIVAWVQELEGGTDVLANVDTNIPLHSPVTCELLFRLRHSQLVDFIRLRHQEGSIFLADFQAVERREAS